MELIDIKKRDRKIEFALYNHKSKSPKKEILYIQHYIPALIAIVKFMLAASDYPSIEAYEESKQFCSLKIKNEQLLLQVERLNKENRELKDKIKLAE